MKTEPKALLDNTPEELKAVVSQWNYPAYRATQILEWAYRHRAESFDAMVNVPAELRSKLASELVLYPLRIVQKVPSRMDETIKYLFADNAGRTIESVLLPYDEHKTICISTQAGCPLQCAFCASGMTRWEKNLSPAEMVSQVLLILKDAKLERIQNVVFMGMGEPFLNYENVMRTVEILNAPWGLGIASRKITLSTAGVVPGIRKLAKEKKQLRLSISLHAPDNALRSKLMPINEKYPLKELLKATKDYVEATGRRVGIEYTLIEGLNDNPEQAEKLATQVKGIAHSVNLIPLNLVKEFPHKPSSLPRQKVFQKTLMDHGIKATLRREKGDDVNAACGQLRLRHVQG